MPGPSGAMHDCADVRRPAEHAQSVIYVMRHAGRGRLHRQLAERPPVLVQPGGGPAMPVIRAEVIPVDSLRNRPGQNLTLRAFPETAAHDHRRSR